MSCFTSGAVAHEGGGVSSSPVPAHRQHHAGGGVVGVRFLQPVAESLPGDLLSPRHRGHVAFRMPDLPCRENLRLAEQVPSRVVVQLHHVAARVAHSLELAEVAVPGGELREAALSPGGAGRDAGLLADWPQKQSYS